MLTYFPPSQHSLAAASMLAGMATNGRRIISGERHLCKRNHKYVTRKRKDFFFGEIGKRKKGLDAISLAAAMAAVTLGG
jgi:hypothetical protein